MIRHFRYLLNEWIFEHNFLSDKANLCSNTLCITRKFNAV